MWIITRKTRINMDNVLYYGRRDDELGIEIVFSDESALLVVAHSLEDQEQRIEELDKALGVKGIHEEIPPQQKETHQQDQHQEEAGTQGDG